MAEEQDAAGQRIDLRALLFGHAAVRKTWEDILFDPEFMRRMEESFFDGFDICMAEQLIAAQRGFTS